MDEASRSVRASSSSIQTILDGYITANRSTHTAAYCHHIKIIIKSNDCFFVVLAKRLSGVRGLCAQKN